MKAQLFEIKRNALDDGPGIRSVLFFKGCALDCVWCHNPESKRCAPELSFAAELCIGCHECLKVCPTHALQIKIKHTANAPSKTGQPISIDRSRCNHCFACTSVCPGKALSRCGEDAECETILSRLRTDYPFFRASGGGVTLSGGEPTLHGSLLAKLLPALKADGVHVLLQTSGFYTARSFEKQIYPYLNSLYFDLKLHDRNAHLHYCGQDNQRILENLKQALARERSGGVEVLPRIALIPGITDSTANLAAWAGELAAQGKMRIKLLRYNPLWPQKLVRLGQMAPIPSVLSEWGDISAQEQAKQIFHSHGITTE